MARAAAGLTDAEIDELAAWFGGERPPPALPSADTGTTPTP